MHDASKSAREQLQGECPVFATSCPFKTAVCSNGRPLLEEIEYLSWSVSVVTAAPARGGAPSPLG